MSICIPCVPGEDTELVQRPFPCSRMLKSLQFQACLCRDSLEPHQMQACWCRDCCHFFFDKLTKSYWLEICLPSHVTIASLFPLTSCPSSNKIMSKQFYTDNNRWDVYLLKPPWGNGVGCLKQFPFTLTLYSISIE